MNVDHIHIETWTIRVDGCTCTWCLVCGEVVKPIVPIVLCPVHRPQEAP